ncbi:hypothetical protein [Desulfoscipio sp. XC116]|uniref:hypothetical protein n=1 Tax=Desulfoscipio sp. XC116 TaxID=3144975 RepID=UPI00325AEA12
MSSTLTEEVERNLIADQSKEKRTVWCCAHFLRFTFFEKCGRVCAHEYAVEF